MAATIAKARGYDTSRVKETHRLGSQSADVEAATWRTHAVAAIHRDGSGSLALARDGKYLLRVEFGPEDAPEPEPGEDRLRIWVEGIEVTPIRKHWGEGYETPEPWNYGGKE